LYEVSDFIFDDLTVRFNATQNISDKFSMLQNYLS